MVDLGIGFAVTVRTDCPHVLDAGVVDIRHEEAKQLMVSECAKCGESGEVWFNLTTHDVLCSRYVKGHMAEQAAAMKSANDAAPGSAATGGGSDRSGPDLASAIYAG